MASFIKEKHNPSKAFGHTIIDSQIVNGTEWQEKDGVPLEIMEIESLYNVVWSFDGSIIQASLRRSDGVNDSPKLGTFYLSGTSEGYEIAGRSQVKYFEPSSGFANVKISENRLYNVVSNSANNFNLKYERKIEDVVEVGDVVDDVTDDEDMSLQEKHDKLFFVETEVTEEQDHYCVVDFGLSGKYVSPRLNDGAWEGEMESN